MSMDLQDDALIFAAQAHKGQYRKYNGAPYITHPIRVAEDLREFGYGHDHEMLAAAYLHDVLEDTRVTETELRIAFGDRVTDIVVELTNIRDPKLNRIARKKLDAERLHKSSSEAQLIKLADIKDNFPSITKFDNAFGSVYKSECLHIMKFALKKVQYTPMYVSTFSVVTA